MFFKIWAAMFLEISQFLVVNILYFPFEIALSFWIFQNVATNILNITFEIVLTVRIFSKSESLSFGKFPKT